MSNGKKLEIVAAAKDALTTYVAEQKRRNFERWKDVYVTQPTADTIVIRTHLTSVTLTFGEKSYCFPIDGYTQSRSYKSLPDVGQFFETSWLYNREASRALLGAMATDLLAEIDDVMSDLPHHDPRRFPYHRKKTKKAWWKLW
jgi:hypothetical protein